MLFNDFGTALPGDGLDPGAGEPVLSHRAAVWQPPVVVPVAPAPVATTAPPLATPAPTPVTQQAPVVTTPSGTVVSDTPISASSPVLIASGTGIGVQAAPLSDPGSIAYLKALQAKIAALPVSATRSSSALSVDRTPVTLAPAAVGAPSSLGTVAVALAAVGALWWFFKGRR